MKELPILESSPPLGRNFARAKPTGSQRHGFLRSADSVVNDDMISTKSPSATVSASLDVEFQNVLHQLQKTGLISLSVTG